MTDTNLAMNTLLSAASRIVEMNNKAVCMMAQENVSMIRAASNLLGDGIQELYELHDNVMIPLWESIQQEENQNDHASDAVAWIPLQNLSLEPVDVVRNISSSHTEDSTSFAVYQKAMALVPATSPQDRRQTFIQPELLLELLTSVLMFNCGLAMHLQAQQDPSCSPDQRDTLENQALLTYERALNEHELLFTAEAQDSLRGNGVSQWLASLKLLELSLLNNTTKLYYHHSDRAPLNQEGEDEDEDMMYDGHEEAASYVERMVWILDEMRSTASSFVNNDRIVLVSRHSGKPAWTKALPASSSWSFFWNNVRNYVFDQHYGHEAICLAPAA
eukprot:CAMPEP_0172453530 /NCGR_PEP_ID=MMETSP1065-20121228/10805_1 /TAXON_ID=265537 /ORGANISM="Amphiprora paludosa, Strain CCMP125" /LENGTH=330 /DNA_ID=CAMNT_0013205713 /DNA_START=44 /DNA_END=1036 /DNA_ORIENTATION=-